MFRMLQKKNWKKSLLNKELKIIEDKLGDYIDWYSAIDITIQNELKVAEEFWDFLGGQGTYQELLDIFERVGIELRPEIDEYFTRYNR